MKAPLQWAAWQLALFASVAVIFMIVLYIVK